MPRRRIHIQRGPVLAPPPRVLKALRQLYGDLDEKNNINAIAAGMGRLHRGLTTERATFAGRPYLDDDHMRLAYATYMLCAQLPKIFPVMNRIGPGVDLPNPLRVLELGSGTGAGAAGLALWAESRRLDLHFHATDFSAHALEETRRITQAMGVRVPKLQKVDLRKSLLSQLALEAKPHLILGMNVFNELSDERSRILTRELSSLVGKDALFVYIEPAAASSSARALSLRDHLVSEQWEVLAPCTHSFACPANFEHRGWCHDVWRFERPDFMTKVDARIGTRRQTLKATWGILRRGGRPTRPGSSTALEKGCRVRAVSERFEEKGRTRIKVCGVGQLFELELQKRDQTPKNIALSCASRYSLLEFEGATQVGNALRLGPQGWCREINEASHNDSAEKEGAS